MITPRASGTIRNAIRAGASGTLINPGSPEFQAAIELGREARRRGEEEILPFAEGAKKPAESTVPTSWQNVRHLLIEGKVDGIFLNVVLPTGAVWKYRHILPDSAEGRVVLVCIDCEAPSIARVFTPTAEGIHPFLGDAIRFGIEQGGAA